MFCSRTTQFACESTVETIFAYLLLCAQDQTEPNYNINLQLIISQQKKCRSCDCFVSCAESFLLLDRESVDATSELYTLCEVLLFKTLRGETVLDNQREKAPTLQTHISSQLVKTAQKVFNKVAQSVPV